ncbi:hypothetical protein [Labrys neptuniae]
MSKSKNRKPVNKKTPPPPLQPPMQPSWKKYWKAAATTAGVVVAIVGLASAVVAFLPRVTIEPGGPIDPSNPNPISFTIANTGIVPLREVQPMLGLCVLIWGEPKPLPGTCNKISTFMIYTPWHSDSLAIDERYTIHLDEVIKAAGKFGGADISIRVDFYPWLLTFWPFRLEKEYRFQTKLEDDGKFSWMARPLDK